MLFFAWRWAENRWLPKRLPRELCNEYLDLFFRYVDVSCFAGTCFCPGGSVLAEFAQRFAHLRLWLVGRVVIGAHRGSASSHPQLRCVRRTAWLVAHIERC